VGFAAARRKDFAMNVLDQSVLDVLLPGFAHHIDIGQDVEATISYGASGLARMVLPGKEPMRGEWYPLPDGYHIAWHGGPAGDWRIKHEAGRLVYVDDAGKESGIVTRIEPIGP
jgi:hypothetical protein